MWPSSTPQPSLCQPMTRRLSLPLARAQSHARRSLSAPPTGDPSSSPNKLRYGSTAATGPSLTGREAEAETEYDASW